MQKQQSVQVSIPETVQGDKRPVLCLAICTDADDQAAHVLSCLWLIERVVQKSSRLCLLTGVLTMT